MGCSFRVKELYSGEEHAPITVVTRLSKSLEPCHVAGCKPVGGNLLRQETLSQFNLSGSAGPSGRAAVSASVGKDLILDHSSACADAAGHRRRQLGDDTCGSAL